MLSQKTQSEVAEAIKGFMDLTLVGPDAGFKPQELASVTISAVLGCDEAAKVRKISKKVADYLEGLFDKGKGNPWAGIAADELRTAVKFFLPVEE